MMKWLSSLSFAGKLRVMIFHAVTAALLLAFLLYAIDDCLRLRGDASRNLESLAATVGETCVVPLSRDNRAQARGLLGALRKDPLVRTATLYDSKGQMFAQLAFDQGGVMSADAGPIRGLRGLMQTHVQSVIEAEGVPLGAIRIDADLTPLYAALRASMEKALLGTLLIGFAAYLWSSRLRQHISVPVSDLVKVTRDVLENKNFAIRANKGADDEFGSLVDGFNNMLAELERRDRNLQMYQNQLEALVQERTGELNRAAADAQRAAKRAEEASRAKSDFLARMSHEIRTPMNGVLGMAELLSHSPTLDDRQRRYVTTIRQSGRSLLEIINDILDFSKIEAGKLVLDKAGFGLREVTEEAAEILAERAHAKGLELTVDIPAAMDTAVSGDRVRLRQVIVNLISNAVKFTERGEVKVTVRQIDPNLDGSMYRFEVSDTGIGIKPENLRVIFESFAQEDSSTTRQYGGTGLGLAICKQLVELMGGQIGVTSTVGRGSTFAFTVPLAADPASAMPRRFSALRCAHLLLIDDHAGSRRILHQHLSSWGVTVIEAQSGREALSILDKAMDGEFGAVMVDSDMPDMSGAAVAAAIRTRNRFATLPLLMMQSANATPGGGDLGPGPVAWISKPIRRTQLYDRLSDLVTPSSGETAKLKFPATGGRIAALVRGNVPRREVLLVEDNPVNEEVARAMLQELNVDADGVGSGEDALGKLETGKRYAAVLMDCQMPKLDGYETTRRFRAWEQAHGRARTTVIALTANALSGDAEKCFAAGMDRYLSKPFTVEQLRTVLEGCWVDAHQGRGGEGAALEAAAALGVLESGMATADAAAVDAAAGDAPIAEESAADALSAWIAGEEAKVRAAATTAASGQTRMPSPNVGAAGTVPGSSDAAGEPARDAVLDEQTLARIRAMARPGGTNLLTKVVGLYSTNSVLLADTLRTSAFAGDAAAMMRAAHSLKSSSANVGAIGLAELCRSIEEAAAEGKMDFAAALVERFLEEHKHVLAALDEQIAA